jgi:hypothetical protein
MFSKIKDFLFGSSPVQSPVATPYKVEAIPAGTEASIIAVSHSDLPVNASTVEAVVVVPEAVVPEAVVEQAPTAKTKAPAIKKPRVPKLK